ncbi:glycosyltransferase [Porphyromonas sp.]|uniref:glycosyltransferase n=1 Tax=Porphyromonas sp. TaxID=1924944 RepID=UPI0026DBD434|nr:glycosyltransferase [Porphyromonas sp.]MDO4770959.1 glycosyltransferase [Porphyromonas sp.]
MKVLLINTYLHGGGAAVACRRLLEALRGVGVDARMLVAAPADGVEDKYITSFYQGFWGKLRWKTAFFSERLMLLPHVGYDRSRLFKFSPEDSGTDISHHPWVEWADIIHVHWVQHGFLSLRGLDAIMRTGKPVFWTLHDLWPITGGCHIPYYTHQGQTRCCEKSSSHCGDCPMLSTQDKNDLAWRQFERKSLLPYSDIHFLAVSQDVASKVSSSGLASSARVSVVPNMIDTSIFYPRVGEGSSCFQMLFVAARPDDPIKGLELCKEALIKVCEISSDFAQKATFVCVGTPKSPHALEDFPVSVKSLGNISSPDQLASLYSSSRVTLSTSLFETFGQTILESISCGTPVLAFRVGGVPDIIREDASGILIPPYDTTAMAQALVRLSDTPDLLGDREHISATAAPFHSDAVAAQVRELYRLALESRAER